MAAVNEDCQLNAARTAQVHDGVESGADGTTRIQDVVHQHDALAVDAEGNVGSVDRGSEIGRIVIAVEADVQAAERNVDALDLLDLLGELLCQKVAARDDADQSEVFTALDRSKRTRHPQEGLLFGSNVIPCGYLVPL